MSSAINMNYGYLQGYNNSLNMNQNVRQDSDGLVIKKNSNSTNEISNNTSSDTVLNKSDVTKFLYGVVRSINFPLLSTFW